MVLNVSCPFLNAGVEVGLCPSLLSTSPSVPWVSVEFLIQLWPGSGRMGDTTKVHSAVCAEGLSSTSAVLVVPWLRAAGVTEGKGLNIRDAFCPFLTKGPNLDILSTPA